MATLATQQQFSGVVERCVVKVEKPFRPSYYSEAYDVFLDVSIRGDDGTAVYFKTPAGRQVVASAPGIAIVNYTFAGESAKWLTEVRPDGDTGSCATPGNSNTNRVEALIRVGDHITVTGRVKRDAVSRNGNPYKVINYVRRQES